MKWILLLTVFFVLSGCDIRKREVALDKKESMLNQKEQELNLREQSLQIREGQLIVKEKQLDSTNQIVKDSILIEHQKLPGTWLVDMQCTETNCSGSAVGDIKNEQWEFKFQDNIVIATASRGNNILRIYSGSYYGNLLRLAAQQDTSVSSSKIVVRLQQTKDNEMEGEREITQENGCRILYALRLKKKL